MAISQGSPYSAENSIGMQATGLFSDGLAYQNGQIDAEARRWKDQDDQLELALLVIPTDVDPAEWEQEHRDLHERQRGERTVFPMGKHSPVVHLKGASFPLSTPSRLTRWARPNSDAISYNSVGRLQGRMSHLPVSPAIEASAVVMDVSTRRPLEEGRAREVGTGNEYRILGTSQYGSAILRKEVYVKTVSPVVKGENNDGRVAMDLIWEQGLAVPVQAERLAVIGGHLQVMRQQFERYVDLHYVDPGDSQEYLDHLAGQHGYRKEIEEGLVRNLRFQIERAEEDGRPFAG